MGEERAVLFSMKYKIAYSKLNEYVCQKLGQALNYPWFKDDQKNFPDSTEEHGVCVGEHVAESICDEAAQKIVNLRLDVKRRNEALMESAKKIISLRAELNRRNEALMESESLHAEQRATIKLLCLRLNRL